MAQNEFVTELFLELRGINSNKKKTTKQQKSIYLQCNLCIEVVILKLYTNHFRERN